jgi:hypothetical protein
MDGFQRRRRRERERDVLRAIRRVGRALDDPRKPIDQTDEVLLGTEDYRASRRGRKIKEPPVV